MIKNRNAQKRRILDYTAEEEINHGIYVSNLAYDLAGELRLEPEECEKVAFAGLVHDIGKLMLNDSEKSSSLVVEEIKYVRMHATLSFHILTEQGFDEDVIRMVRFHHENYDGSGYPDNLQGEQIPFGAKILRICDVFAALTTDRPYRGAFSVEGAIELMIDEIQHFDLYLFLAFQRMIHQEKRTYSNTALKGVEL